MDKKAQAAMEFLMTYGWAILVVLAAIGALAYFGVLSPDRFLPEKCTLPSGIACLDFRYSGTAVEMSIQNGAGFDMTGVSVTINGTGCAGTDAATQPTLTNGQKATYVITCSPSSGKFKGDVTFDYTNQATGMAHSKLGEIILRIP
ncbi:hypothetical protein KY342_00660 [Candidatus Woesearchaeota archaeon]|nr:hypothetical protein [Candidatus Woesearchaeota archaeon]